MRAIALPLPRQFVLRGIKQGFTTKDSDHAIARPALKAIRDDGRAVLILAGPDPIADPEGRLPGFTVGQARAGVRACPAA